MVVDGHHFVPFTVGDGDVIQGWCSVSIVLWMEVKNIQISIATCNVFIPLDSVGPGSITYGRGRSSSGQDQPQICLWKTWKVEAIITLC